MKYDEWFRQANRAIVSEMAIQKVTQKELAQAVGVDPATMNRKLKDPGLFTDRQFEPKRDKQGDRHNIIQGNAEDAD